MNAPDFDDLLDAPWPLPLPPAMDADTYQREAIAGAQDDEEPAEDLG